MGGLEIDEAELSIKSSSLSSVKALFISLLSGLSAERGLGRLPWTLFWCEVKRASWQAAAG